VGLKSTKEGRKEGSEGRKEGRREGGRVEGRKERKKEERREGGREGGTKKRGRDLFISLLFAFHTFAWQGPAALSAHPLYWQGVNHTQEEPWAGPTVCETHLDPTPDHSITPSFCLFCFFFLIVNFCGTAQKSSQSHTAG
jgi:hypothetical protein